MSGCIVKCSFCPKLDLIYGAVETNYSSGNIPSTRPCHRYGCQACHANFYYDSSFRLIGWTFRAEYKNEMFYIFWFEEVGKTTLTKWDGMGTRIITSFSNRAALTPFNLAQKMPTILTFL